MNLVDEVHLVSRARRRELHVLQQLARVVDLGARCRVDLDQIEVALETPDEDLIALDEAVEALAAEDSQCAQLVKLRFFAGMRLGEAASSLGIPRRTANRQWAYARAWLYDRLKAEN